MWGCCDLGDARLPYLAGASQQSVVWEQSLVCVFVDALGCTAMTELYA